MPHKLPDTPAMVHLVDDEAPVRDAISFLLRTEDIAARCYVNGPQLLTAYDHEPLRGCVLLDVRMEPMSGLQVHDALVTRNARLPVLFLTGHGDIPMAVDALKKGAFDFIEKPFDDRDLVRRLRSALAVEAAEHVERASRQASFARLESLTEREREVMLRVARGMLNKRIADELCISMRTVEVHRARVFAKLDLRSAAELALLLSRLGIGGDDAGGR
jgi:two-component system response regulator DctR